MIGYARKSKLRAAGTNVRSQEFLKDLVVISMARLLLADDDNEVLVMLSSWLRLTDQHTVDTASDGEQALDFILTYTYDLIVLDWEMPKLQGIEICRRFKQKCPDTPVLMLTGRSAIADTIQGLDAGADDYITKPFSASELSARVRALLRRFAPPESEKLISNGLTLEPSSRSVTANGLPLDLSPTEFELLEFFLRNSGSTFPVEALISRVWNDSDKSSVAAVRTTINRLRIKLEKALGVCPIQTERGSGYRWD